MGTRKIYISHKSAAFFWRTNPSSFVLDGARQDIRSLACVPTSRQQYDDFDLSEIEFGPRPIDVLIPPGASTCNSGIAHHVQAAALPPHSLYPLRDGIHVVSPQLCIVQMAPVLSFPLLLELAMEFCGTYAMRANAEYGYAPRDYSLMSARAFSRDMQRWKALHGLEDARCAANLIVDGSASPMETKLYLLLCLPQKYGGYNFERPVLNAKVPLESGARELLKTRYVKPDMLWERAKLVVEYDGSYHDIPHQAAHDAMRATVLESMGYTVIQLKKQQVFSMLAFEAVAQALARQLGKRIRPLTPKQSAARHTLREELDLM